jgi:hypothetical protein
MEGTLRSQKAKLLGTNLSHYPHHGRNHELIWASQCWARLVWEWLIQVKWSNSLYTHQCNCCQSIFLWNVSTYLYSKCLLKVFWLQYYCHISISMDKQNPEPLLPLSSVLFLILCKDKLLLSVLFSLPISINISCVGMIMINLSASAYLKMYSFHKFWKMVYTLIVIYCNLVHTVILGWQYFSLTS